jgi:NAD(P)-dependent dehydrogenase (short-subunit alcohol dehydrogenase family)
MDERSVAIITCGRAGIGAAICRHMIEAGHEVVSLARRRPDWSNPMLHAIEVDRSARYRRGGRRVAKKFVARAVMFFAARENTFITGQVLYVCGGTSVASIRF